MAQPGRHANSTTAARGTGRRSAEAATRRVVIEKSVDDLKDRRIRESVGDQGQRSRRNRAAGQRGTDGRRAHSCGASEVDGIPPSPGHLASKLGGSDDDAHGWARAVQRPNRPSADGPRWPMTGFAGSPRLPSEPVVISLLVQRRRRTLQAAITTDGLRRPAFIRYATTTFADRAITYLSPPTAVPVLIAQRRN